jgi:prevent-host-death family protein
MIATTVRDARLHLSKYLRLVENGEEVVIRKHNRAIARLVPERHATSAALPDLTALRQEIAAAHPGAWTDSDVTAGIRRDREGRG